MDQRAEMSREMLEALAVKMAPVGYVKDRGGEKRLWQPVYFGGFWRKLSTFSDAELAARLP